MEYSATKKWQAADSCTEGDPYVGRIAGGMRQTVCGRFAENCRRRREDRKRIRMATGGSAGTMGTQVLRYGDPRIL